MVEARFSLPVRDLQTILDSVTVLVGEARMRFDEEGLQIRAVDSANVAMVAVKAGVELFDIYSADGEVVVGVDFVKLVDVCKRIERSAMVELRIEDRTLAVSAGNMTFTTALISPDAIRKEPNLPNLDLRAEVVLEASEFKKAVEMVTRVVKDEIVFEKSEDVFRVLGVGLKEQIACEFSGARLLNANGHAARAKYSLEYMKQLIKVKDAETVRVRFDGDHICWLSYAVKDGLTVDYLLAPRKSD